MSDELSRLRRIDDILDRFERQLAEGVRPKIEAFLQGSAEDRPQLLRELIATDAHWRQKAGEAVTTEEYASRFPELTSEECRKLLGSDAANPTTSAARRDIANGSPLEGGVPAVPVRDAAPPSADLNLLFGVLALQVELVTRDQLIAAINAWAVEKQTPLGELLVRQKALDEDGRALLSALVSRHVAKHEGDVAASLAAVSSLSVSARAALAQVPDSDVQASVLNLVPNSQRTDTDSTLLFATSTEVLGQRYRVLRPHAKGGLGEVFVARDEEVGRDVALKEIQSWAAADPEARARFLLEAEVTGGLEHPGVVPLYGLGTYADGRPFYAMRFVKGDSLKEAIARYHSAEGKALPASERNLAFRDLLKRFIDVCETVAYAHSRGVLHRDLKPGNVMLGRYGETLLVDWGLAKVIGRPDPVTSADAETTVRPSSGSNATPTRAGSVVGTPGYMSPEQADGRLDELGPASDVYGLGATFYTLLTGKAPVESESVAEVLRKVRTGEIARPRSIAPPTPKALEAVCLKAMALRPRDRYGSAKVLAEDVEHWLADEPVSARHESAAEQLSRWGRRHRAMVQAATAALAVTAAIALLAVMLINGAREREEKERRKAEDLASREATLRIVAQEAEKAARESDAQRRRQLVTTFGKYAEELADAGDPSGALLWCAQAYALEEDTLDQEWMHRERLALLQLQCPRPIAVWEQDEPAISLDFSPDARQLILGFRSGTATVIDIPTGSVRGHLVHGDYLSTSQFSPDGRHVLTAGRGIARLWDAATLQPAGSDLHHLSNIVTAGFSNDGSLLVTGCRGPAIYVWDIPQMCQKIPPLKGKRFDVWSLSVDGKRLLVSEGARATVIDLDSGGPVGVELRSTGEVPIGQVALNDDGSRAAIQDDAFKIRIFDVAHGKAVGDPIPVAGGPYIHRDAAGTHLVTSPWRAQPLNHASYWNFQSGALVKELPGIRGQVRFSHDGALLTSETPDGHDTIVTDLSDGGQIRVPGSGLFALSPNNRFIAAANDRSVWLWDIAAGLGSREFRTGGGRVHTVCFSPDGQRLAAGGDDGRVRIWKVPDGRLLTHGPCHEGRVDAVCFSADGTRIATAGFDHIVRVWDAQTGEPESAALRQGGNRPYDIWGTTQIRFHPTRPDLLFTSMPGPDSEITIWNWTTGEALLSEPDRKYGRGSLSTDGQLLAVPGKIVAVETGEIIAELPPGDPVLFLSPDRLLIAGARDSLIYNIPTNTTSGPINAPEMLHWSVGPKGDIVLSGGQTCVQACDSADGRILFRHLNRTSASKGGAISPNGRLAATSEEYGALRVFDLSTGMRLCPDCSMSSPRHCTFSPNGRYIAVCCSDSVKLLDLHRARTDRRSADEWRELAEVLAGRHISETGDLVPLNAVERQEQWKRLVGSRREDLITTTRQIEEWATAQVKRAKVIFDPRQRRENLKRLSGIWRHDGYVRSRLGWYRYLSGDLQGGLEETVTALELDPSNTDAWYQLAALHGGELRWSDAADALQNALAVEQRPDARLRLLAVSVNCLVAAGDSRKARATALEGLELVRRAQNIDGSLPQNRYAADPVVWHLKLATDVVNTAFWGCAVATCDRDTAEAVYVHAKVTFDSSASSSASLQNTLGALALRAGHPADAVKHLERSVELQGGEGTMWDWLFLALSHAELGNEHLARSWAARAALEANRTALWRPGQVEEAQSLMWNDYAAIHGVLAEVMHRIPLDVEQSPTRYSIRRPVEAVRPHRISNENR